MAKRCAWCGREFPPRHGNQKYCSPECRRLAKNERRHSGKKTVRAVAECKECGKSFEVSHRHKAFCSDQCRYDYYARYNKEYYQEHKERYRERKRAWRQRSKGRKYKRDYMRLSMSLSPDDIPAQCAKLGQTSCLTCTMERCMYD